MPEGPEVESARALVERNVLNLKIIKAIVADDDKVFMGRGPEEVRQALEGRRIVAACRKAKYLWFTLDGDGPMPLLHFGMTGSVVVEGVAASQYVRVTVDQSVWPPKYCKLQLEFEGGARLAFTDSRRFGRVQLLQDPRTEEPVSKLGFDVIDELPEVEEFCRLVKARQRAGSTLRIKALLLDQAFTAGVGNWVADEVLYQARIHPEQPVADMTEYQIHQMHASLKAIMKLAVSVDADSNQFPRDWLFHYRWTGKKASSVGGNAVDFVTVGSRTSAFVPALQRIITGTGLSQVQNERKPRAPKRKAAPEADDEEGADGADNGDTSDAAQPAAAKPVAKRSRAKKVAVPAAAGDEDGEPLEGGGDDDTSRVKAGAKKARSRKPAAGKPDVSAVIAQTEASVDVGNGDEVKIAVTAVKQRATKKRAVAAAGDGLEDNTDQAAAANGGQATVVKQVAKKARARKASVSKVEDAGQAGSVPTGVSDDVSLVVPVPSTDTKVKPAAKAAAAKAAAKASIKEATKEAAKEIVEPTVKAAVQAAVETAARAQPARKAAAAKAASKAGPGSDLATVGTGRGRQAASKGGRGKKAVAPATVAVVAAAEAAGGAGEADSDVEMVVTEVGIMVK